MMCEGGGVFKVEGAGGRPVCQLPAVVYRTVGLKVLMLQGGGVSKLECTWWRPVCQFPAIVYKRVGLKVSDPRGRWGVQVGVYMGASCMSVAGCCVQNGGP